MYDKHYRTQIIFVCPKTEKELNLLCTA